MCYAALDDTDPDRPYRAVIGGMHSNVRRCRARVSRVPASSGAMVGEAEVRSIAFHALGSIASPAISPSSSRTTGSFIVEGGTMIIQVLI